MAQDIFRIKNTYDIIAKEWAESFVNEHDYKPKDREILLRFAREMRDRKPVWDFGCGPGNTTQFLQNLELDISGLDISVKILEQAKQYHPAITFRTGNILDLDFEDNSIAGIVAFYAIVHFTEDQTQTAFNEIFRVLKPGGLFLFTYHIGDNTIHLEEFLGKKVYIDFMFFTVKFITTCLAECGFENIETIERDPYPDVEYKSRRAYVFAVKPEQ